MVNTPQNLISKLPQLFWLFSTITKKVDPVHTRKADWGVEVQHYPFLTLELGGVSSQLHAPAVLPPEKEPPHTPLMLDRGGWAGARTSLDNVEKRQVFYCCQDCNHSFPDVQHSPVILQTTLICHNISPT